MSRRKRIPLLVVEDVSYRTPSGYPYVVLVTLREQADADDPTRKRLGPFHLALSPEETRRLIGQMEEANRAIAKA